METTSFYEYTLSKLKDLFVSRGLPKYAADQVYRHIYKAKELNMAKWSNVSKKVKHFVADRLNLAPLRIVAQNQSTDGTIKYLLGLKDGESIECVAIPMKGKTSLCLSSQVGCAIGCTFCHTATMGFRRHLSVSEIVGQYITVALSLKEKTALSNIVYMGQGEPLHNFENVKKATTIFMEEKGLGLGRTKITISTSGLAPQIEKLQEFPPINIAISLHSTRNEVRNKLMPINKAYDLDRLFRAIKTIPTKVQRKVTYEYLLIKDVNDRADDLCGLKKLIDPRFSKINLIPFNEYPQSQFARTSPEKTRWFQKELLNAGYVCTVRTTKGSDILAACGQLKHSVTHTSNS